MNQAEVIHAGWVHRDCSNLSLLDACQANTRDSLLHRMEVALPLLIGGGGDVLAR